MQELLPPDFNSSSESSEGENSDDLSVMGFDDPWALGEVPEKSDMSDLWVTEEEAAGRKKYSINKQK